MQTPQTLPPVCPVCAAVLGEGFVAADAHLAWHKDTRTLAGWDLRDARRRLETAPAWFTRRPDPDEAPTQKFPALGGPTVFRRPPPPPVRELRGPELLRAIAEELAAYDDEDQADDDRGDVPAAAEMPHPFEPIAHGAWCGRCLGDRADLIHEKPEPRS